MNKKLLCFESQNTRIVCIKILRTFWKNSFWNHGRILMRHWIKWNEVNLWPVATHQKRASFIFLSLLDLFSFYVATSISSIPHGFRLINFQMLFVNNSSNNKIEVKKRRNSGRALTRRNVSDFNFCVVVGIHAATVVRFQIYSTVDVAKPPKCRFSNYVANSMQCT